MAQQRAHLYRPIQNEHGDLLTGATVEVVDPESGSTIPDTLYLASTGGSSKANPDVIDDGIIDFWLASPRYVTLKITPPSGTFFLVEYVFADAPEDVMTQSEIDAINAILH